MTGWLQHAGGVARLIELRSPWRHQNSYERHLLEINRMTICLSCLLKRRRCFLEQRDWITVPWALDPASKTPILRLQDILCAMPGLVEDATNLKLPNMAPAKLKLMRESLSERILSHLRSTYEWRALWERQNPDICYEFILGDSASAIFGIGIEPVFTSVIHFSNLKSAHEITLYNAILILLLRLGTEVISTSFNQVVSGPPSPQVRTNRPLLFPGEARNMQEVAAEICKSVHYHLLDGHNSAGPFYLLFLCASHTKHLRQQVERLDGYRR